MSPNKWGPPIWTLFHTLAEKMREDKFSQIGIPLFHMIRKICTNLPCPDCSQHATQFFSRINMSLIRSKANLRHLLFFFHNQVNKRKNKPPFVFDNLNNYSRVPLLIAYRNFLSVYKTKGNMKLLADNFQRTIIIKEFDAFLRANSDCFVP